MNDNWSARTIQLILETSFPVLILSTSQLLLHSAKLYEQYQARKLVSKTADVGEIGGLKDLLHQGSSRDSGGNVYAISGRVADDKGTFDSEYAVKVLSEKIYWRNIDYITYKIGKMEFSEGFYETKKSKIDLRPFQIVDETGEVRIAYLETPSKVAMNMVSREIEPLKLPWHQTLWKSLFHRKVAERLEYMEEVLPIGAEVTVIGKITEDSQGRILAVEDKRIPFFILQKPRKEALGQLDDSISSLFWKCVGLGALVLCSSAVVGYFSFRAVKYFRRTMQYFEDIEEDNVTDELQEMNRSAIDLELSDSEEDNEHLDAAQLCCICMQREKKYMLLPCGHRCLCKHCAIDIFVKAFNDVKHPQCPICRGEIDNYVKCYL